MGMLRRHSMAIGMASLRRKSRSPDELPSQIRVRDLELKFKEEQGVSAEPMTHVNNVIRTDLCLIYIKFGNA
jgi:hypothetical protein